ncbi:MAG: hypothetical protein E7235_01695 [Lachnospiraceae bacterium]|nr:hypothetical protein [Lachnospiraceae bacterium]
MKYPCELIKDIMPLYIDEVCSDQSRSAVKEHIEECGECRDHIRKMINGEPLVEYKEKDEEEMIMEDSLKMVKKRINNKFKKTVICCVGIMVIIISAYHLLFTMPIKDVGLENVSVSAKVYPVNELEIIDDDTGTVNTVSSDENDVYTVIIPDAESEIKVSGNIIDEHKYISVVTWSSLYHLSTIRYKGYESMKEEGAEAEEGAVYITKIGTTIFNNKAEEYNHTMKYIEFKKVEKIVYVEDNGRETVLWEQ